MRRYKLEDREAKAAASLEDSLSKLFGCLLVFLFNSTVGALCFQFVLRSINGKDIPWYGDVFCGWFTAPIAVPVTIVLWVLNMFGAVDFPLIGGGK